MAILTITHPANGGYKIYKNNHAQFAKTYKTPKDKAIEHALKDFNLTKEDTIIIESNIR